jgi:Flp pilus assembly protein TadD
MLELRQFDDAERDALRAIGIDSSLATASLLLAAARYGDGRARDAVAPAREAVRLDPYDSRSYRVLALSFVAIGRREDAEATVRAGLTVATDESQRAALNAVLEES